MRHGTIGNKFKLTLYNKLRVREDSIHKNMSGYLQFVCTHAQIKELIRYVMKPSVMKINCQVYLRDQRLDDTKAKQALLFLYQVWRLSSAQSGERRMCVR